MKSKYVVLLVVSVIAILAMVWLSGSINERRAEKVALSETPQIDGEDQYRSDEWKRYYPRQYSSWLKTKESGEIHDLLKEYPQLPILWAGYGFAKDYNAPRGHYYALQSNTNSLRTGAPKDMKTGPMPTACWTCKSPDVGKIIERDGELEYFTGKWSKYGAEIKNSVGCANCHDNETSELRINVQYVNRGLKAAGLESFEESTHQQKRSLACATCHSEYYFKKTMWEDKDGTEKKAAVVTFPWHYGLTSEGMEKYYDEVGHTDFKNKISNAPILKAQHPGYEMHLTGIHGQKGVSCADCHMPFTQEGAVKYSDHQLQSPLNTMDRSCMTCHRESESALKAIVYEKYERKTQLHIIAMDNLAKAHLETGKAMEVGATDAELKAIRQDIRTGQWKWDYAVASHGSFFHAPEETLRNLAMGNEYAMNARLKLVSLLAKYGVMNYSAPDFDDKAVSQKLAGLNFDKMVEAKLQFKRTLEKEWNKQAVENNVWNQDAYKGVDNETAYSKNVNGIHVKK
ncbi:MAG: ammonia-forming cytochrome c nitrite reductase [Melioribacteraceae bacterium]|nr:ammonia-forming cytochrome c nitrite reductase [Melioribacteraceae bacterium]